ncbi:PLDc N-terminal domain-containing protein [Chryseobacterium taihuense]|uniref:PLDc N-terminal domain-containing protein n=1 Tax=Chryseobacterium taihuense TaxID=1141221 RepID=UPI00115FA9AC
MRLEFILLLFFYCLLLFSFCVAIIKTRKLKSYNRLVWHLIICFLPIIGPLLFFASNFNEKKND